MTPAGSTSALRVDELRRAFDRTFVEPARLDAPEDTDLIAITIAGDPYALRLSEIAGMYSDRPITWLPGSPAPLLGVAGLRGALLPVYDLRQLLGYPKAANPHWLAVMKNAQAGLAFDRFDNHLRVPPRAIVAEAGARSSASRRPFIRHVVDGPGDVRPLIHLHAVVDAIAGLVHRPKEYTK